MATKNRTSYETALLLALLLKRSGKSRARVSELTVKKLSGRTLLREIFLSSVKCELEELDVGMSRLYRGGFSLISNASLENAPAIVAKTFLLETLRDLKSGQLFFSNIEDELDINVPPAEDDE